MVSEFPSNSKNPTNEKKSKEEPKKVERVIQGEVIRRKKPMLRRLKDTFGGGDAKGAVSFVLIDVILPMTKDMVADAVSQGAERMIFGESRSTSRRSGRHFGSGSNNHTNYQKSFRGGSRDNYRDDPRANPTRKARASFDFEDIIIPTRAEAEDVIDQLFELISKFEAVTVAELYSLVGVTPTYTDEQWGWYDLRGAGPTRISNGYLLELPKPEPLD